MTSGLQLFFKIGAVIILVAGFAVYGLYKSREFLTGPEIIIDSPRDGQSLSNSYIKINGRAKNIASISLNGRQIFTDEMGFFKENLLLARGYNIIEVSATDKFGRKVKKKREIVLK